MGTTTGTAVPLRDNRDWKLLLTGSTVSAIGTGMSSLAFLMLGYALTGSSARAALASAAALTGQVLAMLPAGALVDRWNRQHVMVWTALAAAATFATLPLAALAGHLTYPHLLVVALAEGMLGCFYSPAERGALKRIVPPEQMGTATAANQARSSLGSLLGPPLSGALYGLSRTMPVVVDALTYLWAAACAALVRTPLPAPERATAAHVGRDIVEGMRWVWRTPAMRDVTGVGLLLNMGINGIVTVAFLALQRAGTPAHALGMMESATGAFGLLGALLAPRLLGRVRVGRLVVGGFVAASLVGVAMVASGSIWWIGGLMCLLMVVVMPVNAGMGAFVLHITPDAMQGRASSASGFVNMGAIPLATATSGFLLEHHGRVSAMLVFAAPLALATLGAALSGALRSIPRTSDFVDVPQAL